MSINRYMLLAILVALPALVFGQESVLRLRPYDGTPASYLNAQYVADTAANGGIPANRVYELQRGGLYLSNAVIVVSPNKTMRLRANDSTGNRPVIFLYPTGTGANPERPPGNFIDLRGTLTMKNIILSGYFEPVDTNLFNLQGALITVPAAGAGARITIDSCILKSSNGNHLRTDGATRNVTVTNSIFADMGYLGRSNLGAGKGIDLRDASADTVIFLNNSFVNWQDRIIRHYNLTNPGLGTGAIGYLRFEHNTLVNGMSYHGLLSLGSVGRRAIITNNLFLDAFSLGSDTDAVRQSEFANHGEKDAFGGNRMMWIFSNTNDTTQWSVSNNFYATSDSGQAFFTAFAAAGVTPGSRLSWHINTKIADSVTAFMSVNNFSFTNAPKDMNRINRWYRSPSGGNKTKNTPNAAIWNSSFDFDRRSWQYYNDTLDLAYSTSSSPYTGGTGGFPAGDLNWFPAKKAEWASSPVSSVGQDGALPETFVLSQNYPNPFNPATQITYVVPFASDIRLEVFDLLGRSVALLFDGTRPAGTYDATFDASRLVSGVYFYRLTTPGHVITRRMTLVK
jgi:hypothetical protein